MHRQSRRGQPVTSNETLRAPAAAAPSPENPLLDTVVRAGIIFFEWSQGGGLTTLSESARELTGYGPEAFEKDPNLWQRLIHPDSRATLDAFGAELVESRPAVAATEIRLTTREGRDVVLEARMVPAYGPSGEIVGMRGVAFDATATAQAREAAAEAEERYRRIFEDAPVPMWLLNPETREVLEANGRAAELYGYSLGEMEGLRFEELFAAHEWEKLEGAVLGREGDGKLAIVPRVMGRRKGGSIFPAQASISTVRVGGRKRRLALVRDLSDAEEWRERLTAKRRALSSTGDPVMILDRVRRIAFANAACERTLGFGPEELVGHEPEGLMATPPWADEWARAVELADLGERWSGWLAFRGPGEGPLEIEADLEPVVGDEGLVTHVIVRLRPNGGRGRAGAGESEIYLQLMGLHIEDLLKAARGDLWRGAPALAPGEAAARAAAELSAMDRATDFFRLYGDLGGARGPAVPLEAGGACRDVNEVVGEAVGRLKPVFGPRDVAVFRKSLTTAPCAHPSVAREVLVHLLVEAARAAERGSLRLEMVVAPAAGATRASVQVTILGPRPFGPADAPSARVDLARRALAAIGGGLALAPAPPEGSPHSARFVVTLPCA